MLEHLIAAPGGVGERILTEAERPIERNRAIEVCDHATDELQTDDFARCRCGGRRGESGGGQRESARPDRQESRESRHVQGPEGKGR